MGLLDRFDIDFTGLNRALGRGKHSSIPNPMGGSAEDQGIRGGPQRGPFGRGRGVAGIEDNPTTLLALRGAQCFFLIITFFIFIGIASFQSRWKVGPSGLSIFCLIFVLLALFHSIAFIVVPIVYDRTSKLKSFANALSTIRVTFIVNGTWTALVFLLALINTISANVSGCKNPNDDPHASLSGYKDQLGGFCSSKKAATAFLWFSLFAWGGSLAITALEWYKQRKQGPKIPGFQPGSSTTGFQRAGDDAESGFEVPSSGQHEHDEDDDLYGGSGASGQLNPSSASRPSGTFYDRPLFSEAAPTGFDSRYDPGFQPPTGPGSGGAGVGGGGEAAAAPPARYSDPYDQIRQSLSFDRTNDGAPVLPPISTNTGAGLSGPPRYSPGGYR